MTYDDWKARDDTPPSREPNPCDICHHDEGECDCPCCNEHPEARR